MLVLNKFQMKLKIPIFIELTYKTNQDKCEEILRKRKRNEFIYISNFRKEKKCVFKMEKTIDEIELVEIMYNFLY